MLRCLGQYIQLLKLILNNFNLNLYYTEYLRQTSFTILYENIANIHLNIKNLVSEST